MSFEQTVQVTDDMETRVLKALAEGKAFAFLTTVVPDDSSPIQVGVSCGNGVQSARDLRFMLELALSQLPED